MCPLKVQCAPLHGGRGGKINGPGAPRFGFSSVKKIDPIFLLENASVIAETNFTFGPMFKTNLFPL